MHEYGFFVILFNSCNTKNHKEDTEFHEGLFKKTESHFFRFFCETGAFCYFFAVKSKTINPQEFS